MDHGPSRWHRCLCMARPGAALACPPQMTCQGGTLGYADIWYLQRGYELAGVDGAVISPEALRVQPTAPITVEEDAEALRAVAEKLATARRMFCGHDITSRCDHCAEPERAWRTELAAAYLDLQLAIAHDRQPYPTAHAYDTACAALKAQRERAEAAEKERDRLAALVPADKPPTDEHAAVWLDQDDWLYADYPTSPPSDGVIRLVWAGEEAESRADLADKGVTLRKIGWHA